MKYVVLGSAGFIGSKVCLALLKKGHDVIGIDAHVAGLYSSVTKEARTRGLLESESGRFDFIEGDISSMDLRPVFQDADHVINEAAMPGLAFSWTDFRAYNSSNLLTVHTILEALKFNSHTHLVHASTSSVYGRYATCREDGPTLPTSPYGVTKLAAEHLISSYSTEFGISSTILRYFSVFGPGQRPDMAYAKFIERLKSGSDIEIYGDGRQKRTNTFIDDVVEATLLACDKSHQGQVFNVAGNQGIELLEAVNILAVELGVEPSLVFRGRIPGDQDITQGDISKAREHLGWSPRVSIDEGLRLQAQEAMQAIDT